MAELESLSKSYEESLDANTRLAQQLAEREDATVNIIKEVRSHP